MLAFASINLHYKSFIRLFYNILSRWLEVCLGVAQRRNIGPGHSRSALFGCLEGAVGLGCWGVGHVIYYSYFIFPIAVTRHSIPVGSVVPCD